jgi:hypothetical protein
LRGVALGHPFTVNSKFHPLPVRALMPVGVDVIARPDPEVRILLGDNRARAAGVIRRGCRNRMRSLRVVLRSHQEI